MRKTGPRRVQDERPIARLGIYYHFSNAMQYSNTALETTALLMCDPNMFFYVVALLFMPLQIS